ncbi:hypothetical protein [Desulfuribacillus alkaliarsenatis]|uniref:SHOCT domain-containing protein n=1 Tax=Desulfuribacillus alkaliarsenatis TaxID=766136 RepID=A0A1E5FYC1_9FIRM|nr:hypothetical protein [Desulfuribacillus alkaliarsenatis]OEF95569.1 hypothetical protein BHF68_11980 [Desulfuribacillus alkaliarsenatis]
MKKNIYQKLGCSVIAIAMLLSLLAGPAIVFAQEQDDFTFESIMLSIRPEFDHPPGWFDSEIPAVLVINIADVVNNTNEPITTLSYPAPIDEPNFFVYAVGQMRTDQAGRYFPAPHVLSDGHIHLDLRDYPIMPNEDYRLTVQYYYNPFTIDGARKSFDFEFAPEFNAEEVRVDLQIPPAGRNARVEPAEYALRDVTHTNVNVDNPITIDIAYDKADNRPTNLPQNQGGQAREGDNMLIGFVALMIIIGFVFFLVLKSKPSEKQDRKTRKRNQEQEVIEKQPKKQAKQQPKQQAANNEEKPRKAVAKSKPKMQVADASQAQKDLRKKLIAGEIDEETYKAEIKKLNQ